MWITSHSTFPPLVHTLSTNFPQVRAHIPYRFWLVFHINSPYDYDYESIIAIFSIKKAKVVKHEIFL